MAGPFLALLDGVDLEAPADEPTAQRLSARLRRLSQGLPERPHRALDAAARPLPDARRPRRLARPHLRAAAGRGRTQLSPGLARRAPLAALRGLQERRGEAVLPRAFRPARPADPAGRRAAGDQRRPGGRARPRNGARRHPRLLPARPLDLARLLPHPAHRPDPGRRHQGRPPPPRQPPAAGGDRAPAASTTRWRARSSPAPAPRCSPSPPCAPPARRASRIGGETLPVIVGTPAEGETIGEETFDGRTETAIFPGDLPADPAPAVRRGPGMPGPSRSASCASSRRGWSAAPRA